MTHAEWGFLNGKYKAWLVAETENKQEAMRILPSAYRHSAKIIQITRFTKNGIDKKSSESHEA